jgi:hypothetical protein
MLFQRQNFHRKPTLKSQRYCNVNISTVNWHRLVTFFQRQDFNSEPSLTFTLYLLHLICAITEH